MGDQNTAFRPHGLNSLDKEIIEMISEHSQDIIFYVSEDGTMDYVSHAWYKILGYRPEEVIGKSVFDYYHPSDVPNRKLLIEQMESGVEVNRFHYRLRHKEGHYVWLESSFQVVRDEVGKIIHLFGISRDITERKTDERELLRSQRRNIQAQRIAQIGYWEFDLAKSKLFCSEEIYRLYGNENLPDDFLGIVHPGDREYVSSRLSRLLNGDPFDITHRILQSDGAVRYVRSLAEVTYNSEGQAAQFMGVTQDITVLYETERKLRESEQRYKSLVHHNSDGVCALGLDGQVLDINTSFATLLGYSREELLSGCLTCDRYLYEEDIPFASELIRYSLRHQTSDKLEFRLRHQSGRAIQVSCITVPIVVDGELVGTYIIAKDVTEKNQTEELLRKSEKLSAVGQLAAGVAHEIRNPLTALMGFVQLLTEEVSGRSTRYIEIMQNELSRIEMILSEMLVLAKPQAITYKPKDVTVMLDEVITLLETQAIIHNVSIELEALEELTQVECVENQLKQVFVNVIRNAIDAMPSGGKLRIKASQAQGKIQIVFHDEGKGIPAEVLKRIGEPFYTTKEKGTGLGLMVSHSIIQAHKGTLDIRSEVGSGTKVIILLPCCSTETNV